MTNMLKLLFLVGLVSVAILFANSVVSTFDEDIEFDGTVYIYHNDSLYKTYCNNEYGINGWFYQTVEDFNKKHGAVYGLGNRYLAKTPLDNFYDYTICFKKE